MFRWSLAVFFILAGLIVGVLFGVGLAKWQILESDFFDFRLIEVIRLLTISAIAVWLSYRLNQRLSKHGKLRELVSSQIDRYDDLIHQVMQASENYSRTPSDRLSSEIVAELKHSSVSLNTLCNTISECNGRIHCCLKRDDLTSDFIVFKQAVSDDFLRDEQDQRRALYLRIEDKRNQLSSNLTKLRVGLYQ